MLTSASVGFGVGDKDGLPEGGMMEGKPVMLGAALGVGEELFDDDGKNVGSNVMFWAETLLVNATTSSPEKDSTLLPRAAGIS